MQIDRRIFSNFDWWLWLQIVFLILIGLVVVYSAGFNPDTEGISLLGYNLPIYSRSFTKQLLNLSIGFVAMLFALSLSSNFLSKYAYLIYITIIGLLLLVMIMGLVSHGSQRWLNLGFVRFQPSELVKLGIILVLAKYLSGIARPSNGLTFKNLIIPSLIIGIPTGLILEQPDLGTGLVVAGIGAMMLLFYGVNLRALIIIVSVVLVLIPTAWHTILKPYQKRRVVTLINPDADPLGSGYHIIQSKIAVGSGGFYGKGFLKGSQAQLEFLPERTTDFIFSVLAEEWGFIGSVFLLGAYFLIINSLLKIASRTKETFSALLVFGIASMFSLHVIINIGMVLGLLPVVGLPLPLVSYGGSSFLLYMFSFGLVLGITMRRFSYLSEIRAA